MSAICYRDEHSFQHIAHRRTRRMRISSFTNDDRRTGQQITADEISMILMPYIYFFHLSAAAHYFTYTRYITTFEGHALFHADIILFHLCHAYLSLPVISSFDNYYFAAAIYHFAASRLPLSSLSFRADSGSSVSLLQQRNFTSCCLEKRCQRH